MDGEANSGSAYRSLYAGSAQFLADTLGVVDRDADQRGIGGIDAEPLTERPRQRANLVECPFGSPLEQQAERLDRPDPGHPAT